MWPHDNALIALGMRRDGLDRPFLRLLEGLLDAASVLPDYRLPELFAGFSRADYEDPVPYPVAGHARVDLLFERVAHHAKSVALTDVRIDGQLDVVFEILRAPDPGARVPSHLRAGRRSARTRLRVRSRARPRTSTDLG